MSINADFCHQLLEWNLEEILDGILLSGNKELTEKGCALLMNIIIDPGFAEILCDHYILFSNTRYSLLYHGLKFIVNFICVCHFL